MPLYDSLHHALSPNSAIGTIVDDGSSPSVLYAEALARARANTITALASAQPTIPVDGSGNLALTTGAWQTLSRWAARPYDSFDQLDPVDIAKQAMGDLVSTGGFTPATQATILLHLIWNFRTTRYRSGLTSPNPVSHPSDLGVSPWVLSGSASVTYGPGPDGNPFSAPIVAFGSGSYVQQPAIYLGQAIAGRKYTFHVQLMAPTKATIGLFIGANSGSGDDTTQSVTLATQWQQFSISKTFTASGTQLTIGLDNRTGHGGDGITGSVYVWNASITCES